MILSRALCTQKTKANAFILYIYSVFFFFFLNSPQQCINRDRDPESHGKPFLSSSAPSVTSLSLLGNFEVLHILWNSCGIVIILLNCFEKYLTVNNSSLITM